MNENKGPYKAYDVMTNELLGGYDTMHEAYSDNPGRAITVIYRPGRKKRVK